jgi:hypothetical protein
MRLLGLLLSALSLLVATGRAGLCPRGMVYVIGMPPAYNDTYVRCAHPCASDTECGATAPTICDHGGSGDNETTGTCARLCNTTDDCAAPSVCVARSFDRHHVCMRRSLVTAAPAIAATHQRRNYE